MSPRRAISARMASFAGNAIADRFERVQVAVAPLVCFMLEALCLFGKPCITSKQTINVVRCFRRAPFGADPGYIIRGQSSIFGFVFQFFQ
ncbi:MAG: hypothetical protein IPJ57_21075 [Gemmatimonadetes bacterium]|nr:hypothetical protein [Gemmatimonadota bacterium]